MIGFLRKNNNNVVAAFVNNSANHGELNSQAVSNSLANKVSADSSSGSDHRHDAPSVDTGVNNRQARDDSGSERSPRVNGAQKVPGLTLLQVGGIGGAGKAALTTKASKNGAASFRSRNGGLPAGFIGQSADDCKGTQDGQFPANMPASARGGIFASARGSLALEGGSSDVGGMTSFNNTRALRKRMSVLNNDGLSMREKQDLRDALKNVKEVVDPTKSGAIFETKNSAQYSGGEATTTDYIPKKPVMEHLKKVEMRHNEKVAQYKQYTLDLREKYHKFEIESQRHYANIIKKHQEQTDDIITSKETLVKEMRANKKQSEDELRKLQAKLYTARAEGKTDLAIEDDEEVLKNLEEQKLIAAERGEDLDLDRPVDVKAFEALKTYRNKLKNDGIEWINKFKRAHKRDPTDHDLDEIREQIEEYNTSNNKYILMKAKMIRQGVIPLNLVTKAKMAEAPIPAVGATAVQKRMSKTGFKFDPRSDSPAPANAFTSTKGFHEAFLGDPSIKKLKDDIQQKEKQNVELEDEIQRLRYNLMDKVGDNDVVLGLQREVEIKEDLMKDRDEEIKNLIHDKATIENEKIAFRKEIEQLKVKQLLQKNVALAFHSKRVGASSQQESERASQNNDTIKVEHQKEVNELNEQNEKLKDQVKALEKLQRRTVYGGFPKVDASVLAEEVDEPELKKEKSSESVIAGFLEQNKEVLNQAEDEKKEETVEGAPEVVEVDAQNDVVDTRAVAEAGTNMTISANEAALELQRINDQILEQTREELAMKEDKIKKMTDQVTMLEHALADKEQDLAEQASDNHEKRSNEEAQWEKNRTQMEEHIQELGDAIKEKLSQIDELEQQKKALQDGYEMRLAEKEEEMDAVKQEQEAIQTALKKDIQDLQALVKDQKAAGDAAGKEHESLIAAKEASIRSEADLRVKEKEDEIAQLKEDLSFSGKDMQDRLAEINNLQVQLANQKEEEEKLLKKMEQLVKEAGAAAETAEKLKDAEEEKEELKKANEAQAAQLDGVAEKFKEEQVKRKALLNELEDMKGKIRVYCRIRPFSKTEAEDAAKNKMCVGINDQMSLTVKGRIDHTYNFDSVFGPDTSQDQVFDETKRLIQSAIDGFNVCVFAYGQTGSGKTFTVQGTEQNPGLTPRSITELYSLIGGMKQFDIQLSCYMVEIYKGELRDLLLPKNTKDRPKLEIRMNQQGQVQIKNVVVKPLGGQEDTNHVFETGLSGRQVRKTLMNDESSRSHLIFSIIIDVTNKLNGKKTSGKLSFIDLAGSESSKKTGTDKEGQAEANAINQSLSALGNVISALAEGAKFIRYKENLLTRLMQDSLGGNAKTLMFVNCSPSVYNEMETKNSLEYAKRVKEIKNNPTLNMETKAMQNANRQIETQRLFIESLKSLAQDNGLSDKLAGVLSQYEKKDEDLEGGSVFSLNLDAIKEAEADDNQIKEKPASARSGNGSGRTSELIHSHQSKMSTPSGRHSMRPSMSGPIKGFKK